MARVRLFLESVSLTISGRGQLEHQWGRFRPQVRSEDHVAFHRGGIADVAISINQLGTEVVVDAGAEDVGQVSRIEVFLVILIRQVLNAADQQQ